MVNEGSCTAKSANCPSFTVASLDVPQPYAYRLRPGCREKQCQSGRHDPNNQQLRRYRPASARRRHCMSNMAAAGKPSGTLGAMAGRATHHLHRVVDAGSHRPALLNCRRELLARSLHTLGWITAADVNAAGRSHADGRELDSCRLQRPDYSGMIRLIWLILI